MSEKITPKVERVAHMIMHIVSPSYRRVRERLAMLSAID